MNFMHPGLLVAEGCGMGWVEQPAIAPPLFLPLSSVQKTNCMNIKDSLIPPNTTPFWLSWLLTQLTKENFVSH